MAMKERRLPSFMVERSDSPAIRGSVIASKSRPAAKTRPMMVSPKSTVPPERMMGTTFSWTTKGPKPTPGGGR